MINSWENYEKFTSALCSELNNISKEIFKVASGRKNKIVGKSKVSHQIDVSFEDMRYQKPKLVLVECKFFRSKKSNNKVNITVVRNLKATMDDIALLNTDKEIISMVVCTKGYTEPAREFAEFYKIAIVEISDPKVFVFQYDNLIQVRQKVKISSIKFMPIMKLNVRCKNCNNSFEQLYDYQPVNIP